MIEKTKAELRAEEAAKLPSFAVAFDDVRRTCEKMLSRVPGKFFSEYTNHNFEHVHETLKLLDWVIPSEAQRAMTPGDWFMVVLAIYFHDIGLLITESEYERRAKTNYLIFAENELFSGSDGADYRANILSMKSAEEQDRFLYQEFVRSVHGQRAKCWISGTADERIGCADAALNEMSRLLGSLSAEFRHDLGMICESHNLDDIDNEKKYKLVQPYGNSEDETVNLQYCSILLRSADLLHMTGDRAPAVLARIVNPADPLSQLEWLKHGSVRRVKPRPGTDKDGQADETAPTDTIEVYAKFQNENGFFGLTSFLTYAEKQLRRSHDVVTGSRKRVTRPYAFPWRNIDVSNVEAEGFLVEPFGFEIDQAKILDLLTGHTLYNDSAVAIRELLQNAIDAVRLQAYADEKDPKKAGRVRVVWDSEAKELSIQDNGTGMTQEIIQNHLLKVGSSRYQDPRFKERFPGFSPISRFGIGILSAFMISDNVEIVTVSREEDKARSISLRSVHGKYLIRLLEKNEHPIAKNIGSNGTRITLRLRASARRIDVEETIKHWVFFPRCSLTVKIDDGREVSIGYASPEAAIESALSALPARTSRQKVRVVSRQVGGLDVAFALQYDGFFKDWSFVPVPERELLSGGIFLPIGTAVEGIAVDFSSPGYRSRNLLACANATGSGAPKTNVARSSLEDTEEHAATLMALYDVYYGQVREEVSRLQSEEGYSLTKAITEIPYLSSILQAVRSPPANVDANKAAVAKLPIFLGEIAEERQPFSLADLKSASEFWTIESQMTHTVETLVREAHANVSSTQLLSACGVDVSPAGNAIRVVNLNYGFALGAVSDVFEVSSIQVVPQNRSLNLRWSLKGDNPSWLSDGSLQYKIRQTGLRPQYTQALEIASRTDRGRGNGEGIMVPVGAIDTLGVDGYIGVYSYGTTYLLPEANTTVFLRELIEGEDEQNIFSAIIFMTAIKSQVPHRSDSGTQAFDGVKAFLKEVSARLPEGALKRENEFLTELEGEMSRLAIFDAYAWGKRGLDV